jgi:hypothetical protein
MGWPRLRQSPDQGIQITTTVPGGAQDATCFAGAPGSTTPSETKKFTKGDEATFG